MDRNKVALLILTGYIGKTMLVPYIFKEGSLFIADTILWSIIIYLTIKISKDKGKNIFKTDKIVLEISALFGLFQIVLGIFLGVFFGFGKNTLSLNPLNMMFYLPFYLSSFLALELARTYLTQTTKKNQTLNFLMIGLFYTLLSKTIVKYTTLNTPEALIKFSIEDFIPTLSLNLVANYIACLGGFFSTLLFMGIPAFFSWFSPIIPNPPWLLSSTVSLVVSTMGFILVNQTIRTIPNRKERGRLYRNKGQTSSLLALSLVCSIAVLSSTGLLGVTPAVIASGSMSPSMNVGDVAVVVKVPTKVVEVGDVIQYRVPGMSIIHRVVGIEGQDSSITFLTKGDANNAIDDPVENIQYLGKVILVLPKIGWMAIYIKEAFSYILSFLLTNEIISITVLSITLITILYKTRILRGFTRRLTKW